MAKDFKSACYPAERSLKALAAWEADIQSVANDLYGLGKEDMADEVISDMRGDRALMFAQWRAGGQKWEQPRLRVVFLTQSVERAYHILALAAETAPCKGRRLVYAATQESYVTDDQPLHAPIFLDHLGQWQSLIDLHPTASYLKTPVRLTRPMECPLVACYTLRPPWTLMESVRLLTRTPSPARVEERGSRVEPRRRTRLRRDGTLDGAAIR